MTDRLLAAPTARAAAMLDRTLRLPLLVVGSLPDQARDLDLMVRDEHRTELEQALRQAGFHRQGTEWSADPATDLAGAVVDLLGALDVGVPAAELDRMETAADAIPGLRHLLRPAPDAALLLLAVQRGGSGRLDARRRQRIADALATDPDAFDRAAEVAPRWSAGARLAWLREAYEGSGAGSRSARLRATREAHGKAHPPLRAWWRAIRPPAEPLRVVGLSGLDGSGKSTRARLLTEALTRSGFRVDVLWDRLGYHALLRWVTAPLRVGLRLVPRATARLTVGQAEPEVEEQFAATEDHRAAHVLRGRLPWLDLPWITIAPWRTASRCAAARNRPRRTAGS